MKATFLFLVIAWLSACSDGHDQSTLHYAIRDLSPAAAKAYSVLPQIHAKRGRLSVEIAYTSTKPLLPAAEIERLKVAIEKAMQRWNRALYEKDGGVAWPWSKLDIRLTVIPGKLPCQHRGGVEWLCPQDGKVRFILNEDPQAPGYTKANQRYITFPAQAVSFAGQSELSLSNFEKLILHEYGHILGLGDTYYNPAYQTPENSPKAVMNSFYAVDDLTIDDIIGIQTLWDYLNGFGSICAPSYAEDKAEVNFWKTKFCIPAKTLPAPPKPEANDDAWGWERIDENSGYSIGPKGERIKKCRVAGIWRRC